MTSNQTPQNKNNGCLIGCGATILLIAVLGLIGSISSMMETPEQKAEKKAQVLNEWFESGSDISCESHLKEQLRDPNSYERDGDFTTPTNDGKKRIITWKFRSKNGFGGYTPAIGMCLITKENGGTVKATVLGQ
jgi:Na+-translocating ferredoxin:NAD+ oxidoreductase RnfG subunit